MQVASHANFHRSSTEMGINEGPWGLGKASCLIDAVSG